MYTCRRDLYNKCIILFICFYACISSINAQNIRDNWFFGNRAAVHFSNINPKALNNSAMVAPEGCATLNDSNGTLLCYTDGNAIWNTNHIIINGTSFLGEIRLLPKIFKSFHIQEKHLNMYLFI